MSWSLLFFACLGLLFLLPLLPALAEWRLKRDAEPLRVVRDYDGNIKHFALRFRQFLQAQFAELAHGGAGTPPARSGSLASGDAYQMVGADGQVAIAAEERAGEAVARMLLGTASLQLEGGLLYEKEVFARGDIHAGHGSSFRALLANGQIVLGDDCEVLRWAHSETRIEAGQMSRLYGRVSANQELLLHKETRFYRMHAPTVRFGETLPETLPPPPARTPLERPPGLLNDAAGRWLVAGDWALPDACIHRGDLVVRGDLAIGAHAVIEGSIKCHGGLRVQQGARISGALVSGGDMTVGAGCRIGGPLVSEGKIAIEAGTVLGSLAAETTVTGVEIRVHEGTVAHGTVWARELGYVVPANIN